MAKEPVKKKSKSVHDAHALSRLCGDSVSSILTYLSPVSPGHLSDLMAALTRSHERVQSNSSLESEPVTPVLHVKRQVQHRDQKQYGLLDVSLYADRNHTHLFVCQSSHYAYYINDHDNKSAAGQYLHQQETTRKNLESNIVAFLSYSPCARCLQPCSSGSELCALHAFDEIVADRARRLYRSSKKRAASAISATTKKREVQVIKDGEITMVDIFFVPGVQRRLDDIIARFDEDGAVVLLDGEEYDKETMCELDLINVECIEIKTYK